MMRPYELPAATLSLTHLSLGLASLTTIRTDQSYPRNRAVKEPRPPHPAHASLPGNAGSVGLAPNGCLGPVPAGSQIKVTRMGSIMATENKAANKVTQAKGKIKKEAGQVTDDPDLEAEGQAEESKGDLKQGGEKIKDAFKK
jgi:uncharacterized protein YjbJ (UPF0337 family)